jgi:hypothetical protein
MLPQRYLIAGLDAVARAYPTGPARHESFADAHRGGSLLSSWFMLQDGHAEPGMDDILRPSLDATWMVMPQFAAAPEEPSAPGELEPTLAAFAAVFGTTVHAGHSAIFASLALRALRLAPHACTPWRMERLRAMATALAPANAAQERPRMGALQPEELANAALASFAASARIYDGHYQGFTGHVLTFGCAVLDLHDLGYTDLAGIAEIGYRAYMGDCRAGPAGPHKQWQRPKRAHAACDPDRAAFWKSRPPRYLEGEIGHFAKYAYAFVALAARATDRAAVDAARHYLYEVLE